MEEVNAIITKAAPSALKFGYRWITGKTVGFFGPPEVGKTSFIRYLRTGIPADPDQPRTQVRQDYRMIVLKVESEGRENLIKVRYARDRAGQIGEIHGREILKERPRKAVFVFDASQAFDEGGSSSTKQYLDQLASELAAYGKARRLAKTKFYFLLNKIDKLDERARSQRTLKRMREEIRKTLNGIIHERMMRFYDCSLVEGKDWEPFRKKAIQNIFVE